jgi:DnaK suppressor protein
LIAPVHTDKPQAPAQRAADARPQAASARPVKSAKASAAVKGKPAKVAPKAKTAQPKGAAASKAVPAKKATVKAPVRSTKPAAQVTAKPASKAPVKPAAKPAAKSPAKPGVSKAAKPAVKSVAKPIAKSPTKPAAKLPAVKPVAKPAVKPALKPAPAAPVAAKPASKPVPPAAKPEKAVAPIVLPAAAPAAPASPEPTRRTKGRAAVAAAPAPVVPTHSPDAAKASYVSATDRMSATDRTVAPPPSAAVIRKDPKLANNWKTKRPEDLTDEEVKSMPDSEYMNDVQLAFFRLKLVKLKQDIHNSAGETTEHLREDTVVVPDPADRATIEEEHALELRTRDRERKLLKKIEQSIARIDAGDYGYCDETGEAIGVGRLIARPTASLSLEAQQRRELKQKMFGD